MRPLEPHHAAWLASHPYRTEEWLRERFRDGFDIHHMDGNHDNNAPENLLLIEHTDHMFLHGGRFLGRIGRVTKRRNRSVVAPDGTVIWLHRLQRASVALREHERRKAHAHG